MHLHTHTHTQTFILPYASRNFTRTQVARLASKLPDACAEAANDMTGARPTKKSGARVIEAHELDDVRAKNDDGEDETDDLC